MWSSREKIEPTVKYNFAIETNTHELWVNTQKWKGKERTWLVKILEELEIKEEAN